MRNPGFDGIDTIELTADPKPPGGTHEWTATSGASNVHILNYTSQTAIIKSVSPGLTTIQVKYTYGDEHAFASKNIAVQLPSRLLIPQGGDTGSLQDWLCDGMAGAPGLSYWGVRRQIQYQVAEANGTPITTLGMPVFETFVPVSNTCNDVPNTPDESSGTTLSNGYFNGIDRLALCSAHCLPADANGLPLGSCTLKVDQKWHANGYQVSNNRIEYACRSISVTPLQ
jgi:hypothetical protein